MLPDTSIAVVPDDPGLAVAELATSVLGTVRLAQGLVAADRRIDLAGLDDMVGALCAKALDLPRDAGLLLRPKLAAIAEALDILDAHLAARPPQP